MQYGTYNTREEAEAKAELIGGTVVAINGKYMVTSYPNEEKKEAMRKAGIDPDSIMF